MEHSSEISFLSNDPASPEKAKKKTKVKVEKPDSEQTKLSKSNAVKDLHGLLEKSKPIKKKIKPPVLESIKEEADGIIPNIKKIKQYKEDG